jgi:hypothetical protein
MTVLKALVGFDKGPGALYQVDVIEHLVPRHSDYDWLVFNQSRMGKLPEQRGSGCFGRRRVDAE